MYTQRRSHGASRGHAPLKSWKHMKKDGSSIYASGAYYTHDLPQLFYGLRQTPHDQTHTRPSAHLRLCATYIEIYHAQFFFPNKPNPKNGTGSLGFDILKWTSLLAEQHSQQK